MRFDDGSELVWRQHALPGRRRFVDRLPRFELLSTFAAPDGAVRCRALLGDEASRLTDHDLVDRILNLVRAERIWWLTPVRQLRPTGGFAPPPPPPPPVSTSRSEPPPRATPVRDQPADAPGTFPDDVDEACLAAAIAAASEAGVPFCEECFKAKMAREKAGK